MAQGMRLKPRTRVLLLEAIMATMLIPLVGQLLHWQVFPPPSFLQLSESEVWEEEILPLRGTIKDHHGHILAVDTLEYEIAFSPNLVRSESSRKALVDRLAQALGHPPEWIWAKIDDWGRNCVILESHASPQVAERVRALKLKSVRITPKPKRVYPEGSLAAHLLGFVNAARQGFYGVEGYYQNLCLAGKKGKRSVQTLLPPEKGCDLTLTIHRGIQYMVEQALRQAVYRHQAKGGTIIVLDPRTGAILASASYPSYDPNRFDEFASVSEAVFRDPAVSIPYEPGSVFKVVTIASALEAGVISPEEVFYDNGTFEIGGIENWDKRAHGWVNLVDTLALSLNVVSSQVSARLGADKFYSFVRRFGFGQITEVDLAEEVGSVFRVPGDEDWSPVDLATNSYGQGISVTPLQLVVAIGAVANEGRLMKPYVVERIDKDGESIFRRPTLSRQVISPQTARTMTRILTEALERGAPLARVPGYKVAGKSGTAQVPGPTGYGKDRVIASFVGYVPADDPRFVILVKIDEPQDEQWGSKVAAPVFREVAQWLLEYFGVPPQ